MLRCGSVHCVYLCKQLFFANGDHIRSAVLLKTFSTRTVSSPFCHAKHGSFYQEYPISDNPYSSDYLLQRFIKRQLPKEIYNEVTQDLQNFGDRICKDIYKLGLECEQQLPFLVTQDAWGKRIDELWTCNAWKQQRSLAAEEGIVAIGYERKFHEWSRLYQFCKLYLYAPAAGLYTCPLAMTDGAAKTIEAIGSHNPMFQEAFSKLSSRDPVKFWTSGQWMTERQGGSDVGSGTETVAVPDGDSHKLYGYKWFSSASDADMALTLARIVDEDGSVKQGTKGLSLFYVETRNAQGSLNNFQMVKLKNKLGTRQVPTAELLLDGTLAHKMSDEGCGVAGISNMLTITRIHNGTASAAAMRRILMMARDYSQRRVAFGKIIGSFPLHMQTLARMEVETRGATLLVLNVAVLLGKSDCGVATDQDRLLLRLMTPIVKLYTAKQCVAVISEGLEAFGGQGYIEDTGLPCMLRDAQVLPIWEGTTNILALDVLRSIAKTNGEVLRAFVSYVQTCVDSGRRRNELHPSCLKVEKSALNILSFVEKHPNLLQTSARDLSYSLARVYIGALLLDFAACPDSTSEDLITAERWCELQDICPINMQNGFSNYSGVATQNDSSIVMEGYKKL